MDVKPANILLSCEPRYTGPLRINSGGCIVKGSGQPGAPVPPSGPVRITFKLGDLGQAVPTSCKCPDEGDGRYLAKYAASSCSLLLQLF
jgi:hypothetical protein